MKYLNWLDQVLGAKLREKPVGRPVYLRAMLQLTADHGQLKTVAEQMIEIAKKHLGADVFAATWHGGPGDGYYSAMVEFAAGQTALISSDLTHGDEPTVDLLLLGQHGSLHFEDVPLG